MTYQEISDSEIKRLFNHVDRDSSGDVNIEELAAFVWGDDEIDVVDQSEYAAADGKAAATGSNRQMRSPGGGARSPSERLGSPTRAADRLLEWSAQRDRKISTRKQQLAQAEIPAATPKISRKSRQLAGDRSLQNLSDWDEQKKQKFETTRAERAEAAMQRLCSPVRDRSGRLMSPTRDPNVSIRAAPTRSAHADAGWNNSLRPAKAPAFEEGIHVAGVHEPLPGKAPKAAGGAAMPAIGTRVFVGNKRSAHTGLRGVVTKCNSSTGAVHVKFDSPTGNSKPRVLKASSVRPEDEVEGATPPSSVEPNRRNSINRSPARKPLPPKPKQMSDAHIGSLKMKLRALSYGQGGQVIHLLIYQSPACFTDLVLGAATGP